MMQNLKHTAFFIFILLCCACEKPKFDGENGIKEDFYPDQKLRASAEYKDGKLNGRYVEYYPGGQLHWEGTYQNNKRHGCRKVFHENGKPRAVEFYKMGKQDSIAIYYNSDGQPEGEATFRVGKREGTYFTYHRDGKTAQEFHYKNDKKHGTQKIFYASGQLKSVAYYENGNPGLGLQEYDENGKLIPHNTHIIVKETDQLATTNEYIFRFSLTHPKPADKFYITELSNKKFIPEAKKIRYTVPKKGNYFELRIPVEKHAAVSDLLSVVAVTTTQSGRELVLLKEIPFRAYNR